MNYEGEAYLIQVFLFFLQSKSKKQITQKIEQIITTLMTQYGISNYHNLQVLKTQMILKVIAWNNLELENKKLEERYEIAKAIFNKFHNR
jgi:hypothetical protein